MRNWTSSAIVVMSLCSFGICLRCFECDNKDNPACGVDFKSYQYEAHQCMGRAVKCGLQRQQQIGDFIGIMRRCHILGSVESLNETDGCHTYIAGPYNNTFEICFCSIDYCNSAHIIHVTSRRTFALVCACLLFYLFKS